MGQLKIDNPEKLATQGTEDDEKKIHAPDITTRKQDKTDKLFRIYTNGVFWYVPCLLFSSYFSTSYSNRFSIVQNRYKY